MKIIAITVGTAAAAIALLGMPALAQDEITVSAPRASPERTSTGVAVETVTVSRVVSAGPPLDLTTAAGARELENRVQKAAADACRRLNDVYSLGTPDVPGCIKGAVAKAMPQVEAAVAAANQRRQGAASAP